MTRVRACCSTAAILLAALAAAPGVSAGPAGDTWVLEKGQGVAPVAGSPASLTLDDKQMSGSTGCNTFKATITDRPDKRVAISDVALTRRLCTPPVSNNERAIVQAFSKTEFVEHNPGTLTFLSGRREQLLVWKTAKKAAPPDKSVRAATFAPRSGAKSHAGFKGTANTKLARDELRACAIGVSCKRTVHGRGKHWQITHAHRRCRCLCSWWN